MISSLQPIDDKLLGLNGSPLQVKACQGYWGDNTSMRVYVWLNSHA